MPAMSRFQSAFCRSAPWRTVARRVVLPWALHGNSPRGDVLEIGAGSGAMAAEILRMHADVQLTVTDVDDAMVQVATVRLAPFGDRATARQADANALPFPGGTFDAVLSWVMLHHTIEWETALAEAVRVLRPGGRLVGYDLLSNAPMRALHRTDGEHQRIMRLPELRAAVDGLPVDHAVITPGLGRFVVRFSIRKAA
jgi:ubiquinone/menaquinone biosynthesis C-methylase UbiE